MADDSYKRSLPWLGISLERGTPAAPDDGRYHVLRGAEVVYSTGSKTLAEAQYEVLEEEELAAHPELKDPRAVIAKERTFGDVLSVRGEARSRARSQQEAKGGKGGRSGV